MAATLDFTGLNAISVREAQKDFTDAPEAPRKAVEGNKGKVNKDLYPGISEAVETATEPHTEAEIGRLALMKLTREQEDRARLQEAYGEYQKNIDRSESLRCEILKGVKTGEDTQLLLLKAVECISLMTGDKLFYNQIKDSIKVDK